jgi:LPXTG-site transpeptidase (sortase) family protein
MLRPSSLAIRLAILLLVGGVTVVVAALVGIDATRQETVRSLPPPAPFEVSPTVSVPTPYVEEVLPAQVTATRVPTATATRVNLSPVVRLVIPSIDVDAAVVVLGVDNDGAMESPGSPVEVAWYDFSAQPGTPGNAVFAGHVDYHDYGAAVFWYLRDLTAGDEVAVQLADGTEYRYAVVSSQSYPFAEAPVQEIVGRTEDEVVTLITCGGTFDYGSREYDQRLVVRAQRIATELAQSD